MRLGYVIGLGAVLVLASCQQSQNQSWIGDKQDFPTTKAELYRQYGTPDAIRRDGESQRLRYDYGEGKGMKFGARYQGLGLVISRFQTQADRVWVGVAPDGTITSVEPEVNTDKLRYRLWPFGS